MHTDHGGYYVRNFEDLYMPLDEWLDVVTYSGIAMGRLWILLPAHARIVSQEHVWEIYLWFGAGYLKTINLELEIVRCLDEYGQWSD